MLNLSWELMRADARHVFCFFVIYLVLKCKSKDANTRGVEMERKCCTESIVTMFKSN